MKYTSNMRKETFYIIVIALLIALNLLQLGNHFFDNRPPEDKPPIHLRQRVVNQLNLNKEQEQQFFDLVKNHITEMRSLLKNQHKLSKAYFQQPTDTLLQRLSRFESKKIQITEQHFSDIKSILNEEQYADFEKFKTKALNNLLRLQSPRRPRKR